MDLIAVLLKRLLGSGKSKIKIILMSATLEAEKLQKYFAVGGRHVRQSAIYERMQLGSVCTYWKIYEGHI